MSDESRMSVSNLARQRVDDAGRDADGDRREAGDVLADDRAGADDRAVADRDAVEDLRARAHPGAVADRHAGRCPRLLEHRLRRDRRNRGRRR